MLNKVQAVFSRMQTRDAEGLSDLSIIKCMLWIDRGWRGALENQASEVAVFIAATETFSRKNIGCSIPDSLSRYQEVVKAAHSANLPVRGYISVVAGCPYEASLPLCPGSYCCLLTKGFRPLHLQGEGNSGFVAAKVFDLCLPILLNRDPELGPRQKF